MWLEDVVLAEGVVTGSFEQSVLYDGVERPQLPAAEEIGSTGLYQQFKVPVVACRFTVREVTALELSDDYEDDPVFGIEWVEAARQLDFDGAIAITCKRPNLEIAATDRVVRYARLRHWLGGRLLSGGEWRDD